MDGQMINAGARQRTLARGRGRRSFSGGCSARSFSGVSASRRSSGPPSSGATSHKLRATVGRHHEALTGPGQRRRGRTLQFVTSWMNSGERSASSVVAARRHVSQVVLAQDEADQEELAPVIAEAGDCSQPLGAVRTNGLPADQSGVARLTDTARYSSGVSDRNPQLVTSETVADFGRNGLSGLAAVSRTEWGGRCLN